jgi:hypothetical protein
LPEPRGPPSARPPAETIPAARVLECGGSGGDDGPDD